MARMTFDFNPGFFALTQFLNHPANSATVFNNKFLFTTSEGLFVSTGETDWAGEGLVDEVEAYITLPTSDFGYPGKKSLRSLILKGTFNGRMKVVVTDDESERSYITPKMNNETGCKVQLTSAQRSRYFSFRLSNFDGAKFTLTSAEVVFIPGPEFSQ